MEKPAIAQHVFTVVAKEWITPHYIRVILQGEGAADFAVCTPGANNKIFIPPAGTNEVHFATFDPEKGEWTMPGEHVKPRVRTYTHRALLEDNKIVIDFVDHGDAGPASSWARKAVANDKLGVAMKIRKSALYPDVDWYLLVGDATAIPVLSCILESLPATAKGHCIIEVAGPEDQHPEVKHEGFTIQWLYNEHPEDSHYLVDEAKKIDIPEGKSYFAYVACEYHAVRALREYFKEERQWSKDEFYAFSYWKAGVAEDQSAKERREEKA